MCLLCPPHSNQSHYHLRCCKGLTNTNLDLCNTCSSTENYQKVVQESVSQQCRWGQELSWLPVQPLLIKVLDEMHESAVISCRCPAMERTWSLLTVEYTIQRTSVTTVEPIHTISLFVREVAHCFMFFFFCRTMADKTQTSVASIFPFPPCCTPFRRTSWQSCYRCWRLSRSEHSRVALAQ